METRTLLLANDFAERLVELGYLSREAYDRGLIESVIITASGSTHMVTVDVKMLAEMDLTNLPGVPK